MVTSTKVASCLGIDDIEYGIMDYVNGKQELENILIHPVLKDLSYCRGHLKKASPRNAHFSRNERSDERDN